MKPPKGTKRCPKCGSLSLTLREFWINHSIEFVQDANGAIDPDGTLDPGDPNTVQGECWECGHLWTIPKLHSVCMLPNHPDNLEEANSG